jgi:hypothetical protein
MLDTFCSAAVAQIAVDVEWRRSSSGPARLVISNATSCVLGSWVPGSRLGCLDHGASSHAGLIARELNADTRHLMTIV